MKRFFAVMGLLCACEITPAEALAQGARDGVASALDRSGAEMPGGVYRVGFPRSDLTGHGDAAKLAAGVRSALEESKTPLEAPAKPASQPAPV